MKNLIKVVHPGKNKLDWDEETYRGFLLRETGKNSARDCTAAEQARVLRCMRSQGVTTLPKRAASPVWQRDVRGCSARLRRCSPAPGGPGLPQWHDCAYAGRKKPVEWLDDARVRQLIQMLIMDAKRHERS